MQGDSPVFIVSIEIALPIGIELYAKVSGLVALLVFGGASRDFYRYSSGIKILPALQTFSIFPS